VIADLCCERLVERADDGLGREALRGLPPEVVELGRARARPAQAGMEEEIEGLDDRRLPGVVRSEDDRLRTGHELEPLETAEPLDQYAMDAHVLRLNRCPEDLILSAAHTYVSRRCWALASDV